MRPTESRRPHPEAKVVVPDDAPPWLAGAPVLQELQKMAEVRLFASRPSSPGELVERLQDADAAITIRGSTRFSAGVLGKLPRLCLISIAGSGTDNVDIDAASKLGIVVSNSPGANADAVAEHALALTLAVARRLPFLHQALLRGEWVVAPASQLRGKTLGIVGTGAIGGRLARLAKGIGMHVIAWTPHANPNRAAELGVEYVSLGDLFAVADVVSLHLALTEGTRGLIGSKLLNLMKPTGILINTARGALVDKEALIAALRQERIAGAGLDVFDVEPLPPNDPYLELTNLVVTPHAAGNTWDSIKQGQEMVVRNVLQFLEGRPQNVVDPKLRSSERTE